MYFLEATLQVDIEVNFVYKVFMLTTYSILVHAFIYLQLNTAEYIHPARRMFFLFYLPYVCVYIFLIYHSSVSSFSSTFLTL